MASLNFRGKKALITGGGSGNFHSTRRTLNVLFLFSWLINEGLGICLSLAKELHNQGCAILIADLGLHATANEWLQGLHAHTLPSPSKVIFQKVDVTDWDQLENAFDLFEEKFDGQPPDIVVPGAGLYEPSTNTFWADKDSSSHYKLFDVNIEHPIKMTRIAIRRMRRAQRPGVVVHISSITAQIPSVVNPLYSVSKQAISQFVRCMAPLEELARIRVVAVAPG
jgi:NAD(P)-dependent dehydrogenase (short-subunit alcohol dehydrogenase family)